MKYRNMKLLLEIKIDKNSEEIITKETRYLLLEYLTFVKKLLWDNKIKKLAVTKLKLVQTFGNSMNSKNNKST
jgi:hypothetical protein